MTDYLNVLGKFDNGKKEDTSDKKGNDKKGRRERNVES